MNHSALLSSLGEGRARRPSSRRRVTSDPCLPERLPTSSILQREAEHDAPRAILRQLRRSPSPSPPQSPTSEEAEEEEDRSSHHRRPSLNSMASSTSSVRSFGSIFKQPKSQSSWRDPQPFEVLRAVERKDITYLMEGKSLWSSRYSSPTKCRAFSRWVNHLEDDQMENPKTKVILKALRTNLRLGIDYGLTSHASDLTASFLQTLIMSQGEVWVLGQASNVALALRAGTEGQPVATADAAVRKFATRELGKADLIATLADYIANATADLLMLGAWSIASEILGVDQIPTYYFARDDRVYKAFVERLDLHKAAIQAKLSKRWKWQSRVLRTVLEGRTTTYRSKVESLAGELDQGEGV
ncbi:hypothetical protein MIND_00699700 [Mycena indigotica]|uniref:Uncharacterized protein n=1 Tax=Mycena indigotica TaxID=2126181 RepID=A0A8H6SP10_9AGAR|nr:uncharacterized protein MIND_00699700 [Mycena indigotica]KAF7301345.1 hypothetical protein MIND_00699700 [Mycena indigotica]